MRVYLESLGCARNQVDSEGMLARLTAAGWQVTAEPGAADLIVVNTCSFIESAADESIDTILALATHKKTGRCKRLIVAGCLPERFREETAPALPEVDLFLGTGAYDRIVDAARDTLARGTCLLPDPDAALPADPITRQPLVGHSAYLKIAEGCSRRCTYCIIPKLRGRRKSKPLETLQAEAKALIRGGVRELTLVAQETTDYGRDLNPPLDLALLMEAVAGLDPAVWVRFLYGHPDSLTPAVYGAVARFPNLCPYFDIPIQHAADGLLRRMGRDYSRDDLMRLFDKIRGALPDVALRTTVLVGFPGETGRDFEQLADFIEQVRFDHLGVFAYSDADDLPAHHLRNHVAPHVAQARLEDLMARQQLISAANLERFLGRTLEVLVEDLGEDGLWTARSQFQAPEVDGTVLIADDPGNPKLTRGCFVTVRVVETLDYDVVGEIV
jgi:ribosomal protein S12 methylthiotransferase